MAKLVIQNITKKFGNKFVLDNISFDVQDGEFLSLLGSSGCGKTTLLRILIGIETPTSGTILKDGVDITYTRPKERQMGIVFQNYALFPNMSVFQNVAYALKFVKVVSNTDKTIKKSKYRHLNKDEINERVLKALDMVGLRDQINKKPSKMSGGQQQRVAIARTLVLEPEIILFDEPMAALDAEIRMSLRGELKELQKQLGITMIYVTHDQEEAFSLSDRIIVINNNKIAQLGTPKEIYKHPANEYVKNFVVNQLDAKVKSILESTK